METAGTYSPTSPRLPTISEEENAQHSMINNDGMSPTTTKARSLMTIARPLITIAPPPEDSLELIPQPLSSEDESSGGSTEPLLHRNRHSRRANRRPNGKETLFSRRQRKNGGLYELDGKSFVKHPKLVTKDLQRKSDESDDQESSDYESTSTKEPIVASASVDNGSRLQHMIKWTEEQDVTILRVVDADLRAVLGGDRWHLGELTARLRKLRLSATQPDILSPLTTLVDVRRQEELLRMSRCSYRVSRDPCGTCSIHFVFLALQHRLCDPLSSLILVRLRPDGFYSSSPSSERMLVPGMIIEASLEPGPDNGDIVSLTIWYRFNNENRFARLQPFRNFRAMNQAGVYFTQVLEISSGPLPEVIPSGTTINVPKEMHLQVQGLVKAHGLP
jgi:hypothetical protein